MEVSQTTNAVISNFNETESVEVLSDVVDNAQEMEGNAMPSHPGE
ncbi:hypothetical protein [Salibacterium sp. K-3]